MKIFLFTFIAALHFAYGQENEIFLMYKKEIEYRTIGDQNVRIDSTFLATDTFSTKGKVGYTTDLDIFKFGKPEKEKWKVERNKEYLNIIGKKVWRGKIIVDTVLKYNEIRGLDFILIPISTGLSVPKIKGQLIRIDNDKFNKIILKSFDKIGLQETDYLFDWNGFIFDSYQVSNYSISKDANLTYLGGDEIFQLNKIVSDSLIQLNSIKVGLKENDTIKGQAKYVNRDFPSNEYIRKRKSQIDGNWKLLSGLLNNGPNSDTLKDCSYRFNISNDSFIVQRSFSDQRYINGQDSLKFSFNETGDYLRIEKEGVFIGQAFIIKSIDKTNSTWIINDIWKTSEENKRVKLLLNMKRD